MSEFPFIRLRRNRRSDSIRSLVSETSLSVQDLIFPLFVQEKGEKSEIHQMPNQYRIPFKEICNEVEELVKLGIPAIALFPVVESEKKSLDCMEAWNEKGLIPRVLREVKREFPEICLITDIALDPYNSEGHDGIVEEVSGILEIANDSTLALLCKQAVCYAESGSDIVAPSDMMDGRVSVIRGALDEKGFQNVGILSYAVKYASAYYVPFRNALNSTPRFGNKKTYQMDITNSREAIREALLDEQEGADILMIKPAGFYLDIIQKVRQFTLLPISAYQVSGEYAMLNALFDSGNREEIIKESLVAIKRAGADMIFTYFAKEAARFLSK